MLTKEDWEKWITGRWQRHLQEPGPLATLPEKQRAISALGLAGETGELIEHIKKHLRDGKPFGQEFIWEAGDVLHYLTVQILAAGYTIEQVMEANIDKLTRRDAGEKVG